MILLVAQFLVAVIAGCAILAGVRRITREDRVSGWIVSIGLLLRLGAGVVLFWVSYLDAPFLRGIHSGDGFWEPDARSYFEAAAEASRNGVGTVADWSASPAFVKALALWMTAVGVSPATGVYLNALCYLASCLLVSEAFRGSTGSMQVSGRRLTLAAISLSPAFILAGAQSLKDQFFALWLVLGAVATHVWLGSRANRWRPGAPLLALLALCVSLYVIAGIRPYVAFLWIAVLAAVYVVSTPWRHRRTLWRHAVSAALTIAMLWFCFARGAGAYYPYYETKITAALGIAPRQHTATAALATAREGFVHSGGRTNIVLRRAYPDGPLIWRIANGLTLVAVGIAVLMVPAALLDATGVVAIDQTGGLVRIIDLDTVFFSISIAASMLFMWSRRKHLSSSSYALFALMFAAITLLLMAYVVTNLGTLFRLRLVAGLWFWLAPLAFSPLPTLAVNDRPRVRGTREGLLPADVRPQP